MMQRPRTEIPHVRELPATSLLTAGSPDKSTPGLRRRTAGEPASSGPIQAAFLWEKRAPAARRLLLASKLRCRHRQPSSAAQSVLDAGCSLPLGPRRPEGSASSVVPGGRTLVQEEPSWAHVPSSLPLPHAELQDVQHGQPALAGLSVCSEPQVAEALDQAARQEHSEGQPPPERLSCGEVVDGGAEAWGADGGEGRRVSGRWPRAWVAGHRCIPTTGEALLDPAGERQSQRAVQMGTRLHENARDAQDAEGSDAVIPQRGRW